MKKRVRLAVVSVASLACMLAIPVAGAMPSAAKTWSGDVDFWVVKVDQQTKTNEKTTTAMSFTGAPEEMYIYLTQKRANASATVVSAKTKFYLGDEELSLPTGAVNGNKVDLTAAREYIFDEKVAVSGKWLP